MDTGLRSGRLLAQFEQSKSGPARAPANRDSLEAPFCVHYLAESASDTSELSFHQAHLEHLEGQRPSDQHETHGESTMDYT